MTAIYYIDTLKYLTLPTNIKIRSTYSKAIINFTIRNISKAWSKLNWEKSMIVWMSTFYFLNLWYLIKWKHCNKFHCHKEELWQTIWTCCQNSTRMITTLTFYWQNNMRWETRWISFFSITLNRSKPATPAVYWT